MSGNKSHKAWLVPYQFKPGNKASKGNYTGRPRTVKAVLKELMGASPSNLELKNFPPYIYQMLKEELRREPTRTDILSLVMLSKAMRGDLAAANMVMDRTEGKPVQPAIDQQIGGSYEDFLQETQESIEEKNEEAKIQQGQEVEREASSGDQDDSPPQAGEGSSGTIRGPHTDDL